MLQHIKLDLITYGCGNRFDSTKFHLIENQGFIKPKGGLWSSPVRSSFGWKEYCENVNYNLKSLLEFFAFSIEGSVFVVDTYADMMALPWEDYSSTVPIKLPNYEKMVQSGIDAIFLTVEGNFMTRIKFPSLFGWDCECVLILNPDCVI